MRRTNTKAQARVAAALAKKPAGRFEKVDLAAMHGFTPCGIIAAWMNNHISVQMFDVPGLECVLLSFRRHDEQPLSWDEIQDAKNQTIGNAEMAFELYPPACDVVDVANMRHLWVVGTSGPTGHMLANLSAHFRGELSTKKEEQKA